MKAIAIKDYRGAPEGHTVVAFSKGDELQGEIAAWAVSEELAEKEEVEVDDRQGDLLAGLDSKAITKKSSAKKAEK